jgi:hypothetical protein
MALNERKLSKSELDKREDIVLKMKKNKRDLVKKYGKDAEAVMYGRATNMAKKATKETRDPKITELIKDALKNPKKADLNKDGKLSDYEKTRGAAVEKAIDKDKVKEDLDLGHVDNEPHMIKGDLYRIGKASMDLYKMVDQFDGMGEVDFPSWWQSKIFKAKEALVGAKQYLEFELNEPRIDAVVDVATDVVDETVEDYITSVDDMSENTITEDMNFDKWRRAFNGKAFASKVILAEDGMGNKKRYIIYFRYNETPRADVVSLKERHIGGHEGSGMPFAMSNMQNKPEFLFTSDDKFEFGSDDYFERFLDEGSKGLEDLLSNFLGGQNVDNAIRKWFDTGVQRIVKIGPAEYFSSAAVNENLNEDKEEEFDYKAPKDTDKDDIKIDPDTSFKVNLKHLIQKHIMKEGLPKGFFDKKMKAKDEVDEDLMRKGGKISNALDALEKAAKEAKISGDKARELFLKFKQEMAVSEEASGLDRFSAAAIAARPIPRAKFKIGDKVIFKGSEGGKVLTVTDMRKMFASDLTAYMVKFPDGKEAEYDETQLELFTMNEDYDSFVSKLKKQGQSAKAAKAIAGAVASYKAKGGGKGPTAKQKKRAK